MRFLNIHIKVYKYDNFSLFSVEPILMLAERFYRIITVRSHVHVYVDATAEAYEMGSQFWR